VLFIEHDVYDWKFHDEFAVDAWWAGHKEESKVLAQKALTGKVPEEDKERILKNISYC